MNTYRADTEYYFNPVMFVLPPLDHKSQRSHHNLSERKKDCHLKLKPLETWLPETIRKEHHELSWVYTVCDLVLVFFFFTYLGWVTNKCIHIQRFNIVPSDDKHPRSIEVHLREILVNILSGASENTSVCVLLIWEHAHPTHVIKVTPERSDEIFSSSCDIAVWSRCWLRLVERKESIIMNL